MPTEPSKDAQLSDICISTSAAPTYLPAHYFQNGDREFNLIDGTVAANNPVNLMTIYKFIYRMRKIALYASNNVQLFTNT